MQLFQETFGRRFLRRFYLAQLLRYCCFNNNLCSLATPSGASLRRIVPNDILPRQRKRESCSSICAFVNPKDGTAPTARSWTGANLNQQHTHSPVRYRLFLPSSTRLTPTAMLSFTRRTTQRLPATSTAIKNAAASEVGSTKPSCSAAQKDSHEREKRDTMAGVSSR